MGESILKEKSFDFSLRIIAVCRFLVADKKEYVLSRQLLKSGTAIGALVREARNAESKADFIHKLGIAQKECDETLYWLELLTASGFLKKVHCLHLYPAAQELLKMIRSSILTARQYSKGKGKGQRNDERGDRR